MEKVWIFNKNIDQNIITKLSEELKIDKNLAHLLVQRGVKTYEEAKKFFRPSLSDLYDPFLMKDMELAIIRLNEAIENNEKILIYGDYDVDGTTSVALVYSFLENYYEKLDYYIPDRYLEGYGISYQGIDFASENNFSLVIALDCGIKAMEKIKYAKEKNIDFIICDHHEPDNEIPKAVAVLDAKRKDCNYPFKELSGCGVGFKLLQAFAQKNNIPFETLIPYLDLVVVSIASDIVPIVDENRILARFGLEQLNKNPRIGLKKIIDIAGIKNKEIGISDIVFKIGPRINAAGRIEQGKRATNLLTEKNEENANIICKTIDSFNTKRKNFDTKITEEALDLIKNNPEAKNKKANVLYSENWHKGVIGIVASRVIETYYRPTIILTKSNGLIVGSARSVADFDLYKAIDSCSDLFVNFGGHKYAAGLSLKEENLKEFTERFEKIVSEEINEDQLKPKIHVDNHLNLDDITPKFLRILKQFAPFGPGNMSPVFTSKNIYDWGNGRKIGKKGQHIKLDIFQFIDKKLSKTRYEAIGFNLGEHYNTIKDGIAFHICYSITENIYNNRAKTQLNLKDIKILKL